MKKLLCAMLSIVIALSFAGIVFAADAPVSKTEAFINGLENGVGVNANVSMINGLLYVKKDKAVADVSIGPLNAKAILDDGKFTAYLSIFKADLTQLLPKSTIAELTGIVNEVPKAFANFDTTEIFKYLTVDNAKSGKDSNGNYIEVFGPNYEEIAKLIVEENPDALNEMDKDDIVAFCEYFAQDSSEIGALLNSKATFTYKDESAKTLVGATVAFPDENGKLNNIDVLKMLEKELGIKVGFITIDVDDSVFKAPFALLNITWLIKLIIKAA